MGYAAIALDELLELLGAATPAPASGTAAALTGALAATDLASGAARAAIRLVELNLAATDDPRRDRAAELARQAGTWIAR